jgi:amidohydrolase
MTRGADAASCDYFKITIHGRGAHISNPDQGIDALYMASLIVTELKTLAQRLVPLETALIGVGKIVSGSSYNIIAGDAVLEGTTRTFSYETQDLLKEKITEIAARIAAEHGGSAITEFETFASALINDDTAYDEAYAVSDAVVGAENIITDKTKIMGLGADDFADYIRDTKGVYVHIGTSNDTDAHTRNSLHSKNFDIDEQALLIAASLHIEYTLSILSERKSLHFE